MKKPAFKDSRKFDFKPAIIIAGILVVLIAILLAIQPLRTKLSNTFIERGNQHLLKYQYVEALVDYKKSEWLRRDSKSQKMIEITDKSQLDVSSAEQYFREINNLAYMEQLNEARAVPGSESEGLRTVKQLLADDKPQFAEVAAQNLLEMDENSAKVWVYLGIANFQSARLTQMTEQNRRSKLDSAIASLEKALALDASDQLAKKYLEEAKKLL